MDSGRIPRGIDVSGDWWGDLTRRYSIPERAYHGPDHVREVLVHWHAVDAEGGWTDRASTWVAVLLHDAVYVPGTKDNESRSAELVPSWVETHHIDCDRQRAAALIRLTARHGHLDPSDVDEEAALFLDCDMAILGSDPARFDRYDEAIRREYAGVVPAPQLDAGRRAFLAGLLRNRIFLSDRFHQLYDATARANISRHV